MKTKLMSYLALDWLIFNAIRITLTARRRGNPVKQIPNGITSLFAPPRQKTVRYHPVDFSKPVPHVQIPHHPFMGRNGSNNMHCDAYISDTFESSGPLGVDSQIRTKTEGFGGYGTMTFDSHGRFVSVYSNGRGFKLEVLDPFTFARLGSYSLPPRPFKFFFSGVRPWEYLGAGMYFYLDHLDRAVVPTTRNTLQVIQTPPPGTSGFKLVREYDLRPHVVPGKDDSAAFALPEWSGEYYWYATTDGMVGTINVNSGAVQKLRLDGELIENSFAVGEEGVFIISDLAMYRFSCDANGKPVIDWRTEYSKAAERKAGHISVGSGTSVTLAGTPRDGLIVIADNADPRINVLFIQRSDGKIVGSVPVFEESKSGTDLTMIAFENADETGRGTGVFSSVIENNWGPHTFPIIRPEPGITRVDAIRNADGTYTCKEVWANKERSIGGFRLSLANGLVYMYGNEGTWFNTKWYLIAVDFRTGETVFKQLAGTGMGYNNWQGCLYLHPQGGTAYSTTIFGAVMISEPVPVKLDAATAAVRGKEVKA